MGVADNVNARLTGNRVVTRLFAPGEHIGLGAVQAGAGAAVGTYLIGRYCSFPSGHASATFGAARGDENRQAVCSTVA